MTAAYLERRLDVVIKDADGIPIAMVGDAVASYTRTEMNRKDEYSEIIGDGKAKLSMGLGEKIGGPYGYSSVDVRVNVTLTCNQDEKTLADAAHLAFKECIAVLDDSVDQAMAMLKVHLARNYEDTRGR